MKGGEGKEKKKRGNVRLPPVPLRSAVEVRGGDACG